MSVMQHMSMVDTIRDASEEDLSRIVEIYNASIPGRLATADTDPVTVESRKGWFREHNPHTRPLWVAEHAGAVIAWISLSSFYGRPAYNATAEFSLYVDPAFQGRGIGKALLQRLIDRCPAFGVTTVVGYIFGHNEPSLRLAEQLGFVQRGLLPGIALLDGIKRDLVILCRTIE